MTATNSTSTHNGHGTPVDPEALRQEIARTRASLGETVEALAAKADVKTRAQDAVHNTVATAKLRMREGVEQMAVNATYARRELRMHPRQAVGNSLRRMLDSARERPAPWIVASGLFLLAALISYRKGQQ
ncbi:DUF3618 domain-containing protein [Dactylosporangium sp. AC04546]|uniref:DUF3618 domain-containing protein n=1 Tax=Dactylosporangium sp. AC04546 TaxID=2862460 RepID=UPI0027E11A6B|nr:DUF3618 domain-containing protein [Dactylosporangium sp. AC04546]WVK85502.1 DUF3618 domain-containing protein [Dactylosporangium sp. AC04546]